MTPWATKRILQRVRRGMPLKLAAAAAGMTYGTLASHREKNERFAEALQKAIARGVDARLKKIETASESGDWRAAAWLLEHCQPEHFAKNRLEVTGADGAPLAGAVAVYLPQKEGLTAGAVTVEPMKEIQNGD